MLYVPHPDTNGEGSREKTGVRESDLAIPFMRNITATYPRNTYTCTAYHESTDVRFSISLYFCCVSNLAFTFPTDTMQITTLEDIT